MMPVPVIANPIPLKPKGRFSVEELIGRNTEELPLKFQNSSLNILKTDSYFSGYPVIPRSEIQHSLEHYTPTMYHPLTAQDYANLEYLELLRSRMSISSTPTVLGTDMHPWLFNNHPRFFPQRMQGPESLFFNPFRKPKRVRTAFSPSQLLQLEHAFEKNHYVVGNERRQLAEALHLTETQVKVWFQNRRTKHKRQKQDGDQSCENKSKDFCDTQEQYISSEDEASALQEINPALSDKMESSWNSSNTKEFTTSTSEFPSTYDS